MKFRSAISLLPQQKNIKTKFPRYYDAPTSKSSVPFTAVRGVQYFMERAGRVLTREQLLDGVWDQNVNVEDRAVDVHIRRLRKALNGTDEPDFLRTVRAVGYCLDKS